MCGIVGIMNYSSGAICGNDMPIFMQMLHADAVRGMHGTGVFAVDRDGTNCRVRVGGPPHQLVASKDFDKFENFIKGKYVRAVIGHNRFATRGGHTTEFAHPFRDGDITLLHNGTLEGNWKKALPDGKKFESDSEALCHSFAIQGPEATIKSIEGAWTLVWYDMGTKTINFLRNSERPLWFAHGKTTPYIAFASEPLMLEWIMKRNSRWEWDLSEFPTDKWYSYTLDDAKPHVKELKGKGVKASTETGWQSWGTDMRGEAAGTGKSVVEADQKVVPFVPLPLKKTFGNALVEKDLPLIGITDSSQATRRSSKSPKAHGGEPVYKKENSIHDLGLDQWVIVDPYNYKVIQDAATRKETLFQALLKHAEYPDIDFLLNIKGEENLDSLLYATHGVKCKIRTILRSMSAVAKSPHQIHLKDPEPLYTEEPVVPSHAEVKQ